MAEPEAAPAHALPRRAVRAGQEDLRERASHKIKMKSRDSLARRVIIDMRILQRWLKRTWAMLCNTRN